MVFQRDLDGREQASAEVLCGEKKQRLSVMVKADESTLVLTEGGVKMRSWPLHAIRLNADQPGGNITIEAGGESVTWFCGDENARKELSKAAAAALAAESGKPLADEALGALLEDAAPDDADAEQWVKRLAERLAKLDALNVGGMLAAATEGGGAKLAERLEAGAAAGAALSSRLGRYDGLVRGAVGATAARSGAARADASARALLAELEDIYSWLDAPALADLDSLPQVSLSSAPGRARALAACEALLSTLRRAEAMPAARRRLAAVRDRLRRIEKAKEHLAAALARHLNNALIHLGNEAAQAQAQESPPQRHHAELRPLAACMRAHRDMDERAYAALAKVYVGAWSRVYEREIRAAVENAKQQIVAQPDKADEALDQVLDMVETLVNNEQDFCVQFFHLDVDVKAEASDGERSEKSEGGGSGGGTETRRVGAETRRLLGELFPAIDELTQLVAHMERHVPYGAMRALACVSRRVLGAEGGGAGAGGAGGGGAGVGGAGGGGAGDARWFRGAIAGVAVAAKRGADKLVADKIAAMPLAVKQAARKPKCGILPFIPEFEEMARACEAIFASGGRRADLERWYVALATAMMQAVQHAEHPRTPRAMLHTENYHRLHGALSARRVAALEPARRECRARYEAALRAYVAHYFPTPLEKLAHFLDGVAEAVASGVKEEEVCYRAAFSKHELRKLVAMYPPHEVRKSLHRLYRTVDKHVSEEGGLLQVVWRHMQQEFLARHAQLQARIAACYPGAGVSMPLSTQDILDAFSDIAREH